MVFDVEFDCVSVPCPAMGATLCMGHKHAKISLILYWSYFPADRLTLIDKFGNNLQ